ncbi:PssE/Cps14G family polysaccharide biosynthesis glycosyltransferase [Spirosoma jeollabukense]
MIFVVTGTQEPFDRMVRAIDQVAAMYKTISFIAQVSKSALATPNLQTFDFIPPVEFNNYFDQASLIISHAGTGTIFSALERDKPIIIMPRLAQYGEHRNDHQLATCQVFERLGYVNVAYDEEELKSQVIKLLNTAPQSLHKMGKYASNELIESLQEFIGSSQS